MNKLTAMKTFVQIVDSGSLTSAADVLDTSLPTVVRTLASLEDYLKTRLMNRTTRKVTLTEEGRQYLERCRRILFDIEEAELELSAQQTEPTGKLSLTSSVMFGSMRLTPLINKFLQQYTKVSIDLLVVDHNVNLVEEGIDVGIRIGTLSDSSMVAKNVGYVRRVICGTPKFLNSIDPVTSPADLQKTPCIRFSGLSQGGNWSLFDNTNLVSIPVSGPLSCNQMPTALNAVQSHMGLGMFLSYMIESQVASGELQIVLANYEPPPLPVSVVFSHAKLMSTRVRVFVDWITLELRRELGS
jgi:DNA-binding transcriptional LysR family regulator